MPKTPQASQETPPPAEPAKCAEIANRGINTSQDTIQFLGALISDISSGRITGGQANATCNAIGKMLKTADLEAKYGTVSAGNSRILSLVHRSNQKQLEAPEPSPEDIRASALLKLSKEECTALGLL